MKSIEQVLEKIAVFCKTNPQSLVTNLDSSDKNFPVISIEDNPGIYTPEIIATLQGLAAGGKSFRINKQDIKNYSVFEDNVRPIQGITKDFKNTDKWLVVADPNLVTNPEYASAKLTIYFTD